MSQEVTKSAERLKQEIDIKKEELKFLNAFYLPLYTATGALMVSGSPLSVSYRIGCCLIALLSLSALDIQKRKVLLEINSLIKKL